MRDIQPWQFLDVAEARLGAALGEDEFCNVVLDLIDERIVENSMRGLAGVDEDELPLRVRLTELGRRIMRKYDADPDRWREAEDRPSGPAAPTLYIGGSVSGSNIGQTGRGDIAQSQTTTTEDHAEQIAQLLERALENLDAFDLDQDDREELEDAAEGGIRAAREIGPGSAEATNELPGKLKRRANKALELLDRVGTGAAGSVAAHEIIGALGPHLM